MPAFTHAVIGCGRVAPNHVDGFSALPDTVVAWACDRDIERARALARECGIEHVTDDPREVLEDADADADAVSIAVDHAQHAELAQRAGKLLSVVSQHRYDPVVRAVRRWIAGGLLGRLVSSTVDLQRARTHDYYGDGYWRETWADEGGSAVINQGRHALDVTRRDVIAAHLTVETPGHRPALGKEFAP